MSGSTRLTINHAWNVCSLLLLHSRHRMLFSLHPLFATKIQWMEWKKYRYILQLHEINFPIFPSPVINLWFQSSTAALSQPQFCPFPVAQSTEWSEILYRCSNKHNNILPIQGVRGFSTCGLRTLNCTIIKYVPSLFLVNRYYTTNH